MAVYWAVILAIVLTLGRFLLFVGCLTSLAQAKYALIVHKCLASTLCYLIVVPAIITRQCITCIWPHYSKVRRELTKAFASLIQSLLVCQTGINNAGLSFSLTLYIMSQYIFQNLYAFDDLYLQKIKIIRNFVISNQNHRENIDFKSKPKWWCYFKIMIWVSISCPSLIIAHAISLSLSKVKSLLPRHLILEKNFDD